MSQWFPAWRVLSVSDEAFAGMKNFGSQAGLRRDFSRAHICLAILGLVFLSPAMSVIQADEATASRAGSGDAIRVEIGRTDAGQPLVAWGDRSTFGPTWDRTSSRLVLMTVPDDGSSPQVESRLQAALLLRNHLQDAGQVPTRWVFVLLPSGTAFPPSGPAYHTEGQRTSAALWRSLAWLGVDLVVEGLPEAVSPGSAGSLCEALRTSELPGFGHIPAVQIPQSLWKISPAEWTAEQRQACSLDRLTSADLAASEVGQEFRRRLSRSPEQVCAQLLNVYGNSLKTVMYQPALAVIARRQFSEQQGNATADPQVAKILEPYFQKRSLPAKTNGSVIAGHLVFADWALATGDSRAVELVRLAADVGFSEDGTPLPAMPSHNEMSDAVFMGCPILTAAARLTQDEKYLEQFARHLEFIQKLDRRPDGIYRNSPLCEAAWGRGNGFPMLGLALALTDLQAIRDDDHQPARLRSRAQRLFHSTREDFQQHAQALLKYQDVTGMWRQVIDEPSAYREMTATCMLGFAMQRGVQQKWLESGLFQPAIDRAWQAVLPRIAPDGVLLDVCTGTGKQNSLQGYYDRTAIFDVDERGGAMALIFAVERLTVPR